MDADQSPFKIKVDHNFFKTFMLIISSSVTVVVFAFSTFATKTEVSEAKRHDENTISHIREDVKELRQDVKELLKHVRKGEK